MIHWVSTFHGPRGTSYSVRRGLFGPTVAWTTHYERAVAHAKWLNSIDWWAL